MTIIKLPTLTPFLRFNETFRFLFWTMFGVANQDYVDMPEFVVAEFVGRILYGIFTLVIVIVLLNMLIAMITNSFQKIEVRKIELRKLGSQLVHLKGRTNAFEWKKLHSTAAD